MDKLRCNICGKPLDKDEIDKQPVIMATAIGKRMLLCDRDYDRVLKIFKEGETHARIQDS